MKKKITKLLSATLCFAIIFSAIPLNAFATDDESYVAFGDSIPAGVALTNPTTENFVALLDEKTGVVATNRGISGLTAADLKTKMVTNNEYDADIIGADYITITIGGNDLMAVFYGLVAKSYNSSVADTSMHIEASDVAGILADSTDPRNMQVMFQALAVINAGYGGDPGSSGEATQAAFEAQSTTVKNDIHEMLTYIRGKNQNAKIYVTNQYNPYKGIILLGADIGAFFASGLTGGGTGFNDKLADLHGVMNCAVIDIYSVFEVVNNAPGTVTNATLAPTTNLDFHPTADGHEWYRAALTDIIPLEPLSGTATIGPLAQFGKTLKAALDGKNPSTISYQWKRNGVDISGQTNSTYTLTQDDIGKNITVAITANGASYMSGTIISAPLVGEKADATAPAPPVTGTRPKYNSINVVTVPNQEYSIDGSNWQTSGTFVGLSPNTKYTVVTRVKETATHKTSPESNPSAEITTLAAPTIQYTQSTAMGSSKDVVFRIEGREPAELNSIWYNGEMVDPANYDIVDGSVIVTFRGSYVRTLPIGTHTFSAMFETDMIDLNLQVTSASVDGPSTGDSSNTTPYVVMGLVALGGIALTTGICRRKFAK